MAAIPQSKLSPSIIRRDYAENPGAESILLPEIMVAEIKKGKLRRTFAAALGKSI